MKTKQFLVTVVMPYSATVKDVEQYISDAVQCHGGGLDPEHPCFNMRDYVPIVRSTFQGFPAKRVKGFNHGG